GAGVPVRHLDRKAFAAAVTRTADGLLGGERVLDEPGQRVRVDCFEGVRDPFADARSPGVGHDSLLAWRRFCKPLIGEARPARHPDPRWGENPRLGRCSRVVLDEAGGDVSGESDVGVVAALRWIIGGLTRFARWCEDVAVADSTMQACGMGKLLLDRVG